MIVAWAVSSRGDDSLSTPISAAGVFWLVAHHAAVSTPEATVTLLPLALLALPLVLLVRAGRWAARITAVGNASDAVLLVGAGTAGYAGVAVGVASMASIGDAYVSAVSALAWAAGLAVVGLTVGVLQESGLAAGPVARLPHAVRDAVPVALAAGAALVVAAGAVTVAAIATRWSTVTGLVAGASPGAWDSIGLFLVSLAYLPNLLRVGAGLPRRARLRGRRRRGGRPVLGVRRAAARRAAPRCDPAGRPRGRAAAAPPPGARRGRRRSGAAATRHLHLLDEARRRRSGASPSGWRSRRAVRALRRRRSAAARLAHLGPSASSTGLAVVGLVAAGAALWLLLARVMPTVWVRESDLTVEP